MPSGSYEAIWLPDQLIPTDFGNEILTLHPDSVISQTDEIL